LEEENKDLSGKKKTNWIEYLLENMKEILLGSWS
jgi:hypothetical protein